MTLIIDRVSEKRKLAAYSKLNVERIMLEAGAAGAAAAMAVLKARAPVGESLRLSQYYRAHGMEHGALRESVRAAPIRTREGIGEIVGPMGVKAFARFFVEARTHWLERNNDVARAAAYKASDAVLRVYARRK